MSPRRGRDDGLTLVEMLISVTILATVLAAVSGITLVAMRTATTSGVRLDESNDLQRAASYFGDDVQGAQTVSVATTPRCGTDSRPVVELQGQDFTDDATLTITTTVVTYVLRSVARPVGAVDELRRLSCTAATTTPAYPLTPFSDVSVVRRLSTTAPTVAVVGTRVDLTVRAQSGSLSYTLTGRRRIP